MKKMIVVCLLFVMVNVPISARPIIRIKFQRGHYGVTVIGVLNGHDDSQTYLIRLRGNQGIRIEANKPIVISVRTPKDEPLEVDDNEAGLISFDARVAGDYKIEVRESRQKAPWKGKFKMNLDTCSLNEKVC